MVGGPIARRSRWAWLSLLPIGLGAWAPIYGGVKARKPVWWAWGVLWSATVVAGLVLANIHGTRTTGGGLLIVGWVGAIATSFTLRTESQALESPFQIAVQGAEERLAEREQARRLAREQPALARELGIGRPDLANAQDAGLNDVNNASATSLVRLPGIDDAMATRIVEARAATHGFSSVEDLGTVLNLDGNLVENLRDRVVFLPR
jgi:hypothetical protein